MDIQTNLVYWLKQYLNIGVLTTKQKQISETTNYRATYVIRTTQSVRQQENDLMTKSIIFKEFYEIWIILEWEVGDELNNKLVMLSISRFD